MTEKDRRELSYWVKTDPDKHLRKYPIYLSAWEYAEERVGSLLEIGVGPYSGFLPFVKATRKVGLDPLIYAYQVEDIFRPCEGVEYVNIYFEEFHTEEKFDVILTADTLDHGDLGFQSVPQIAALLKPGGRLYLHVHLRPYRMLNMIHDHALRTSELDATLRQTALVEVRRKLFPKDIDGNWCEAIVGVWRNG